MTLLGQNSPVPARYSPEILHPIPRAEARARLGLAGERLPFHGEDLWHAWELAWLAPSGQPRCAVGRFVIPATSENLVESKSFKLYLNSLNQAEFADEAALKRTLVEDLSAVAGGPVEVTILELDSAELAPAPLPGSCIDRENLLQQAAEPDPALLHVEAAAGGEQVLHSHCLRSLCPVTAQPDWASVIVRCAGRQLMPASLLTYLHSFREHQEFHEQCVERMFRDIRAAGVEHFSVQALYTRRGGLDINPWRSSEPGRSPRLRSPRQ